MKEEFPLRSRWEKKPAGQSPITEMMLCDKYAMNEYSQSHAHAHAIAAFNDFNLL